MSFLTVALLIAAASPVSSQKIPEPTQGAASSSSSWVHLELANPAVDQLRLEVFGIDGTAIYDSGLVSGRSLSLPRLTDIEPWPVPPASFEIRAWDAGGELLLSQVSRVSDPDGGAEIFSIDFEVIPNGTRLAGSAISLDGNVDVQGDLDMADHTVRFNNGFGLAADGGARMQSGGLGGTFQFFSGPGTSDLVQFRDGNGNQELVINFEGGVRFIGGQKVCSVFTDSFRTTQVVSAGWTGANCEAYRAQVVGGGSYQLGCLFDDGFTFGTPNGGIPSQDCGWG